MFSSGIQGLVYLEVVADVALLVDDRGLPRQQDHVPQTRL